jgi:hypothetical protein
VRSVSSAKKTQTIHLFIKGKGSPTTLEIATWMTKGYNRIRTPIRQVLMREIAATFDADWRTDAVMADLLNN